MPFNVASRNVILIWIPDNSFPFHSYDMRRAIYVANEDAADVSLEHILPLEPSSDWNIDEDMASAAQKLLGNMALLKATQNRDLGNSGFDKKRAVFGTCGYYTTKDVADYTKWTMDEIRDRQRKLAALAVKTNEYPGAATAGILRLL